jgi:hypothetical protein
MPSNATPSGPDPQKGALGVVERLIRTTQEQAQALRDAGIALDDIGANAGVNVRLQALQDVRSELLDLHLREQQEAALGIDPAALRAFLDSEAARELTGTWGFDTTTGGEFREQLIALAETKEADRGAA